MYSRLIHILNHKKMKNLFKFIIDFMVIVIIYISYDRTRFSFMVFGFDFINFLVSISH